MQSCAPSFGVQKGAEEHPAWGCLLEVAQQATPFLIGDVVQRTERTRREEGLACSPPDAPGIAMPLGEPVEQHGLAHTGLPAHHDHAAAAGFRLRARGIELSGVGFALE